MIVAAIVVLVALVVLFSIWQDRSNKLKKMTLRDDGVSWWGKHLVCPDCGSEEFLGGPRGGASQNVKCGKCESKFNLTDIFGTLLLERIGS